MRLFFFEVKETEHDKIEKIYNLLKKSGQNMHEKYALTHWRNPLPIEAIARNCGNKHVFIAKDEASDEYVHTFCLDIEELNGKKQIKICKFSTAPEFENRGIASESIKFIEDYSRKNGITSLMLDVYVKSEHAINFYIHRGFKVAGYSQTKHFTVLSMQKEIEIDA